MDSATVFIFVLAAGFVSVVVFLAVENRNNTGKTGGKQFNSSQEPSRRR